MESLLVWIFVCFPIQCRSQTTNARVVLKSQLRSDQFVNHFPEYAEITTKDKMYANIKGSKFDADFLPLTFSLSSQHSQFMESFARTSHIISQYIKNPLLLQGKKFDLRLYVLVRSWNPMVAYFYRRGFARICPENYSVDSSSIQNRKIHLTNISLSKGAQEMDLKELKMDLKDLKAHLEKQFGASATINLFRNIENIIKSSLSAVRLKISSPPNCFELYGYDILIDSALKPWLMEVNCSPSLMAKTPYDVELKTALIDDLLNIIFPSNSKPVLGDFVPLFESTN